MIIKMSFLQEAENNWNKFLVQKFLNIVILGIMILDQIKIVLYQNFLLIFLIEFY